MSEGKGREQGEKLDVRLNEAFERLEKRADVKATHKTDSRDTAIATNNKASIAGYFLVVFLALVGIGIASYAAWRIYEMPPVADHLASVQRRLSVLEEKSTARANELQRLSKRFDRLRESQKQQIGTIENRVDEAVVELKRTMGTSSEDWLLAEVEYLLRLANHRVLLERDPKGAIALFEAADKIVRDAEGITAFGLRKAIAEDIAKLKAVRNVDVDGIFLEISALKGLVGDLKQRQLQFTPAPPAGKTDVSEPEGFTEKALALLEKAGSRLAGMVQFRTEGEKIRPVLPPEEEYYLRQNLILKLQLAQLALLRGDREVYANSLAEARQWVVENFDKDDSVTTALLNSVDRLMEIPIERDMPDVSGSLREARALLASFHQADDSGSADQ